VVPRALRDRPLRGDSKPSQLDSESRPRASYTVEMSVDAWINLADHPRRRDTERHIRKPEWELLIRIARGPVLEMLRWVAAGQVGDEVWKVDGHSRALLWANGSLPRPESIFATVISLRITRDVVRPVFNLQQVRCPRRLAVSNFTVTLASCSASNRGRS